MKKMDATYENILNTIEDAKDNAMEAHKKEKEAASIAADAVYLLGKVKRLIKLRREIE